jgi:hypothetical protein
VICCYAVMAVSMNAFSRVRSYYFDPIKVTCYAELGTVLHARKFRMKAKYRIDRVRIELDGI